MDNWVEIVDNLKSYLRGQGGTREKSESVFSDFGNDINEQFLWISGVFERMGFNEKHVSTSANNRYKTYALV